MIETNLLAVKKDTLKVPVILGMDISQLNWVGLIVAFLVLYFSEWGINKYFNDKNAEVDNKVKILNKTLRKVTIKVKKNEKIKDMLEDFDKKKKELKTRTMHVKKILDHRANPVKILERIARDVSDDIWFDRIKVDNNVITLTGASYNYHSIGNFISKANDSKFFGKSIKVSSDKVKTRSITKRNKTINIEEFEAVGKIVNFE